MAFTLQIKSKGMFARKKLNFQELLSRCRLAYGVSNAFYVLEEISSSAAADFAGAAILYRPARIGRGIYFDAAKAAEGYVEVSYNIPTTEAEITDFLAIVEELNRQYQKTEMYCVEEERTYTLEELLANKDRMAAFSLQSLHNFCSNKEYSAYIFSLAMWPYALTQEEAERFAVCEDLREFEELIHSKQDEDIYYAKPALMRDRNSGEVLAFYTLTEECDSIFPMRYENFLCQEQIKADKGFVRFFIYSENRAMDGFFDYDRFVSYVMGLGATAYGGWHVRIPPLTKEAIRIMAERIG